jgi:hypothetical protein
MSRRWENGKGWTEDSEDFQKILSALKRIEDRLETIDRRQAAQFQKEEKLMAKLQDAIDALTLQVTNETTVEQSAITLINEIPVLIAAAVAQAQLQGATSAQLTALTNLATTIQNNAANLATAVAANTPSAGVPAITSPLTATATVGSPFSFQVAASNAPTSFAATGLPAGLSIDPAAGLITGTPTGPAGNSTVALSATNAAGTSNVNLILTVAVAAP